MSYGLTSIYNYFDAPYNFWGYTQEETVSTLQRCDKY